ncbi:hypothetical protein IMZ48_30520, partial [Candidatus Bathyarchaeota archaeon]|nr:hypothetical protein [Candidatus Bathyarchaeota archaeon]
MSEPNAPAQASGASAGPKPPKIPPNDRTPCLLFVDGVDSDIVAADKSLGIAVLGIDCEIGATLRVVRTGNTTQPAIGFTLSFPLPDKQVANIDSGFGVRSKTDLGTTVKKHDHHVIEVRFPRAGCHMGFQDVPAEMAKGILEACPGSVGSSCFVVRLDDDARVRRIGYGMPFENPEKVYIEQWLNEGKPIFGNTTLDEFLSKRQFVFVAARPREHMEKPYNQHDLPPEFVFPLGTDHAWNPTLTWENHLKTLSADHWNPHLSCEDNNSLVGQIAAFNAFDNVWVGRIATAIKKTALPAYCFPRDPKRANLADPASQFYVVIAVTEELRVGPNKRAWSRLTKGGRCKIELRNSSIGDVLATWYVPRYPRLRAPSNVASAGLAKSWTTRAASRSSGTTIVWTSTMLSWWPRPRARRRPTRSSLSPRCSGVAMPQTTRASRSRTLSRSFLMLASGIRRGR